MSIARRGDKKAKPNPFEEIAPENQKLMQEWSDLTNDQLASTLYRLKEKQLKNKGISPEDFKAKYLSKPFADLKELESIGCLDGFEYLDDRKNLVADGVFEFNMLVPNRGDNLATLFRQETSVEGLLNNRFRPL